MRFRYCEYGVNGKKPTEITREDLDALHKDLFELYDKTVDHDKLPFGCSGIKADFYLIANHNLYLDIQKTPSFLWHSWYPDSIKKHKREFGSVAGLIIIITTDPSTTLADQMFKAIGVYVKHGEDADKILDNPPEDRCVELHATQGVDW